MKQFTCALIKATAVAFITTAAAFIAVQSWGSTEEMPPKPEPQPEPEPQPAAEWVRLNVYNDQRQPPDTPMYVKGLEGQSLTTSDSDIIMGPNNRVWVMDSETTGDGSKNYWAYQHNYLGGTVAFEVDLSKVDCACASRIYLVHADEEEETCNWDAKARGETPQCSRIEIMEANKLGFTAAAYPCEFGVCPSSSETQQKADEDQYGAGAEFVIDSTRHYNVRTKFFAPLKDGEFGDLAKIETYLSQDDRQVVLRQDNKDYLYELTNMLRSNMAVVLSNSDAGESNNISNGQCTSRCGEYKTRIWNTVFTQNDSVYEEPDAE